MKRSAAIATASAVATLALTALPQGGADAQRCVSGANVRHQVSTFVHGLHDEVQSAKTRHAVKTALVESVRAARGAKADSPHESRGLGQEIRVIAHQLKDAKDKVTHDALVAQLHALQDQKKASRTDREDVQALRSDLTRLAHDIARKADTPGQGRQVSSFVHALMAQFNC